MVQDLNDYRYFVDVVSHGGFAPAGRALRLPKSKLSRRIAGLEASLGVRLIERSTRRFRVTEVGQALFERCRTIMMDVEQAEAVVAEAQGEPHGTVRFSCPLGLIEVISPGLPGFLNRYPKVRLQIIAADQPVDLIAERIDVALRVRIALVTDAALTMRTLAQSRRILVASPQVARAIADDRIDSLTGLPTLSSTAETGEIAWELIGPDGARYDHLHTPRVTCADFAALRAAAIAGLGVTFLPDHFCAADLAAGRLVHVLPDWHGGDGIVHVVFTTRRGLPPAVRVFIDHLARLFRDFPNLPR